MPERPTLAADAPSERPPPLRWAADAEGGAAYICKDPRTRISMSVSRSIWPPPWKRNSAAASSSCSTTSRPSISGLQRGDFDFAMNGIEVTPDRVKAVRFTRPYYVYSLQLVVRADDTRFSSLDQCKPLGATVGTLEDTAAERLLAQEGITKKVYGNQVEPYVDLGLGRIDAVLLDLPIASYIARPNPKLKFVGPADRPRLLRHRLPQGAGVAGRPVRRRLGPLGPPRANCGRSTKIGTSGTSTRNNCWPGNSVDDFLRESGRLWTFGRYFPLLLQGAVVTVGLTVLSMLLAMALALPHRADAAVRARAAAARGHGLRRVLPRHSRALAPVLPLLRAAGDRRELWLAVQPEAPAGGGGHFGLRTELRGLRGGNLSRRHRLDSRRAVGGRRLAGHDRGCTSSAASSCRRPSASSCPP